MLMGMTYDANLGLDKVIEKGRALLGPGSPIQRYVTSTVAVGVAPYVPALAGKFAENPNLPGHTDLDNGIIQWIDPRARLLYYNVVYIDPLYKKAGFTDGERWWSRKDVKKVPSDLPRHADGFNFNKSRHPNAGPFWCERYKADHLKELAADVQRKVGEVWNRS